MKFARVILERGCTVRFEFTDGSVYLKSMGVKRQYLKNAKMRDGGAVWVLSNGVEITAEEIYSEMEG